MYFDGCGDFYVVHKFLMDLIERSALQMNVVVMGLSIITSMDFKQASLFRVSVYPNLNPFYKVFQQEYRELRKS